jgi:hypothetical protein
MGWDRRRPTSARWSATWRGLRRWTGTREIHADTLGGVAQRELAERGEVAFFEKIRRRRFRAFAEIDFSSSSRR